MAGNGSEKRRVTLRDRIARAAIELCCSAYGVSIHEMLLAGRSRASAAYARQVAMYLSHVVGGITLGELSAAFQRDRSTVGHACHIIEDRRDSPVFDREVEALEQEYREQIARFYAEAATSLAEPARAKRSK